MSNLVLLLLLALTISQSFAFQYIRVIWKAPKVALYAANKSLDGNKNTPPTKDNNEKKLSLSGIAQLIGFGAGAPVLGEYKGTDPTTGKMFFELEANNLVDSEGNDVQMKGKFFKDGWTEESNDAIKPPGFFANLLSGGKVSKPLNDIDFWETNSRCCYLFHWVSSWKSGTNKTESLNKSNRLTDPCSNLTIFLPSNFDLLIII